MQTQIHLLFQRDRDAAEVQAILAQCVHCGFCNATCPTYQILGDERDGPRGRIYQIKQMVEGQPVTAATRLHLDRCLLCRNCETTCPSGVRYGALLEIGRAYVERLAPRRWYERLFRWGLRWGFHPRLFGPLYAWAQRFPWLLPAHWREKLFPRFPQADTACVAAERADDVAGVVKAPSGPIDAGEASPHPTALLPTLPADALPLRVILPRSCVQPSLAPQIDHATRRVLEALGCQVITVAAESGCCGAMRAHLGDVAGAAAQARRNIDAWLPLLETAPADAGDSGVRVVIVSNASGCGLAIKEYPHLLRHDAAYHEPARRVAATVRDLGELLAEHTMLQKLTALAAQQLQRRRYRQISGMPPPDGEPAAPMRLVYHPPCTLQHGQQSRDQIENILRTLASLSSTALLPVAESHLCCGSAGAYALLHTEISHALRARKLAHLLAPQPSCILSANIGCLSHLQAASPVQVRHWVEWVDQQLAGEAAAAAG